MTTRKRTAGTARHVGALTIREIRRIGAIRYRRPGERWLDLFLHDYNAGDIPHTEVTDAIAAAFRRILDGDDANAALGLKRKGRPPETPDSATYRRRLAIARYLHEHERDDPQRRGAPARATQAAIKKFHLERSRVDAIRAEFRDYYPAFALADAFRLIDTTLTTSERKALSGHSFGDVVALARARKHPQK